MPSALNSNNNTKLEKQSSVSSGSAHTGGGGGGTGNQPVNSMSKNTTASASVNSESSSATSIVHNNDCSSTSSNKEKSGSTIGGNSMSSEASNNPLRQTLITIEHKIRNLEKRKTKLESYRAIQATGKELSADQKAAVAKYDAVMATLDFARDLSKQMLQYSKEAEKEQKKQQRKDLLLRTQAETAKIREVLVIQNIMTCLTDEAVRTDFLNGENGAVKLHISDLNAVDKFYMDIQTRRPESVDDASFASTTQKAAEFFSMTIDGRPKQHGDTTYENLRRIFNQIEGCGYLDKCFITNSDSESSSEKKPSHGAGGDGEELLINDGIEKLNLSDSETEKRFNSKGSIGDDGSISLSEHQSEQPLEQDMSEPLDLQVDKTQQTVDEQVPLQQQSQSQSQVQHMNATVRVAQSQPIGPQAPPASALPAFQPVAIDKAAPAVNMALYAAQQQLNAGSQVATGAVGVGVGVGGMINMPQQQQPQTSSNQSIQAQTQTQPHAVGGAQQRQVISSPVGAPAALGMHGAPPQPASHFPATTVRAVEHGLFKQHQQHQQFLQQIRPLAEVIGGGSFYFLQDSELDSPDMGPVNTATGNISSVIFEQQKLPQTQTQSQVQPQPQPQPLTQPPSSIMKPHPDIGKPSELRKTPDKQHLVIGSMQPTTQQISTQTFTNQSFPPIPQVQSAAVGAPVSAVATNRSNTPSLSSNTPSPMFHQKHPQLFSPVAGLQHPHQQQQQQHQQLLQQQQQQQQHDIVNSVANVQQLLGEQQPIMMITRLSQTRLTSQSSQSGALNLQGAGDSAVSKSNNFPFDNPVATILTYEQQVQQQLAAAVGLKTGATVVEEKKLTDDMTKYAEQVNDWEASLKSARAAGGASNALANILKPTVIDTNKWSTEMNSVGSPTTSSSNSQTPRKSDWSTGNGSSSYAETTSAQSTGSAHESNHWNTNQPSDVAGSYGRANSGGNGGGPRGPPSGGFQRRGDDRRDRDDRSARGPSSSGGPAGGNGGGYRGRINNYGSSSAQQNGGRGGNGSTSSGIYFRNNENTSSNSQYYQNGVYSGGKDGSARYDSGSYRGPRGGNGGNGNTGGNGRGNAPPQRSIGGRNGGTGSTGSASYLNNPRQSNRLGMSLENKN